MRRGPPDPAFAANAVVLFQNAQPAPPEDVVLLREIRDSLRGR
jgi:large-conductance mechanosensitive channel